MKTALDTAIEMLGGIELSHAKRLIETLKGAGIADLAIIVGTMHGAADMARKQGKPVVAACFLELQLLAVAAFPVKRDTPPGKAIEVPPSATIQ